MTDSKQRDWECIQERRPGGPADDAIAVLEKDRVACDLMIDRARPVFGRRDKSALTSLMEAQRYAVDCHAVTESPEDERRMLIVGTLLAVERGLVRAETLIGLVP